MTLISGIKQISQVGNDMYIQGAFPVSVANTDVSYLADPADTRLLAGRDPVIKEVSVGMTGEEAAVYDVSGTPPLSLPNSLGKPLKAWSVDVLPYQEGTGDPSPDNVRPIYGTDKVTITTAGKNLLPFDSALNDGWTTTLNGLTATYSNGYMRVTGTNTSSGWTNIVDFRTQWYSSPITINCASRYIMSEHLIINCSVNGVSYINQANAFAGDLCMVRGFYIAVHGDATVDWNIPLMFTFGTERPRDYTPYLAPSQTVLTLPQTVYTGTVGSGGGESSTEELDLATIDSTRWRFGAALNDGTGYYVYITGTVSNPTTMISDRYVRTSVGAWEALSFGQFMATTYLIITVPNECSTLESARDYLINTNKPQFVMSLSTPTEFALSTPTIPTPRGTATTWATAEDGTVDSMSVSYVGGL